MVHGSIELADADDIDQLDGSATSGVVDDAQMWSRREAARQRQIMIGKARPEYRRYVAEVPPLRRSPSQPTTPDTRARVSKRQFDRALGEWRRRLHEFDSAPWLFGNDATSWEEQRQQEAHQDFERALSSPEQTAGCSGSVGVQSSPAGASSRRSAQRRQRGSARGVGSMGVASQTGVTSSDKHPAESADGGLVRISLADWLETRTCTDDYAQSSTINDDHVQVVGAEVCAPQFFDEHHQQLSDMQMAAHQAQVVQQFFDAYSGNISAFEAAVGVCPWPQGGGSEFVDMSLFPQISQSWFPETPQKAPLGAKTMDIFTDDGETKSTGHEDYTPEKQPLPSRPSAAQNAAAFAAVQESLFASDGCEKAVHGEGVQKMEPLSPSMRPKGPAWPMPDHFPKSPRTPNPTARYHALRTPNAKETGSIDDLHDAHVHRTPASLAATPCPPCWALETPSPERVPRYDMRSTRVGGPLGGLGTMMGGPFGGGQNMQSQLAAPYMGFMGADFRPWYPMPSTGFPGAPMLIESTAEAHMAAVPEVSMAPLGELPNAFAPWTDMSAATVMSEV